MLVLGVPPFSLVTFVPGCVLNCGALGLAGFGSWPRLLYLVLVSWGGLTLRAVASLQPPVSIQSSRLDFAGAGRALRSLFPRSRALCWDVGWTSTLSTSLLPEEASSLPSAAWSLSPQGPSWRGRGGGVWSSPRPPWNRAQLHVSSRVCAFPGKGQRAPLGCPRPGLRNRGRVYPYSVHHLRAAAISLFLFPDLSHSWAFLQTTLLPAPCAPAPCSELASRWQHAGSLR